MQLSPGLHIRQQRFSLVAPPYDPNPCELVRSVKEAPFAVLSHDTEPGAPFTFANDVAQRICGLSWTSVDLRQARGPVDAAERQSWSLALDLAVARGCVDRVDGVRDRKSHV